MVILYALGAWEDRTWAIVRPMTPAPSITTVCGVGSVAMFLEVLGERRGDFKYKTALLMIVQEMSQYTSGPAENKEISY